MAPPTRDLADLPPGASEPAERPDPLAGDRPPRRASKPLLLSLEAAAVGALAFLAAGTGDGDPDVALVVVGWVATAVSGASVLAFAFRVGDRDRAGAVAAPEPTGTRGPAADPVAGRLAQRPPRDRSS